jgi:hypothetical protein
MMVGSRQCATSTSDQQASMAVQELRAPTPDDIPSVHNDLFEGYESISMASVNVFDNMPDTMGMVVEEPNLNMFSISQRQFVDTQFFLRDQPPK